MSVSFDKAAICKNGHIIADSKNNPRYKHEHCKNCGKEIIRKCPSCSAYIIGRALNSTGWSRVTQYSAPAYCYKCGEPFPWTLDAIASLKESLSNSKLSTKEKLELSDYIPHIFSETPKTSFAVSLFKKFLPKMGDITKEAVIKILVTYACEYVKQHICR